MKCVLNLLLPSMIPIQLLVGFSFSSEQLFTFQVRDPWTNFRRTIEILRIFVLDPYLSTVEQTLDPMYSLNLSPMKTPSIGYRQGEELILILKHFFHNKPAVKISPISSERNTARFAICCGQE